MTNQSHKSYTATLILAILVGWAGIHRFYAGKVGTGILYLLTFGFLGIGWIIDIIMVATGSFTDKSGAWIKPGSSAAPQASAPIGAPISTPSQGVSDGASVAAGGEQPTGPSPAGTPNPAGTMTQDGDATEKPFYTRWWFIAIVVVVVIGFFAG